MLFFQIFINKSDSEDDFNEVLVDSFDMRGDELSKILMKEPTYIDEIMTGGDNTFTVLLNLKSDDS